MDARRGFVLRGVVTDNISTCHPERSDSGVEVLRSGVSGAKTRSNATKGSRMGYTYLTISKLLF